MELQVGKEIQLGYNASGAMDVGELGNIAMKHNAMTTMDEGTKGHIDYNIGIGVNALSGADLGTGGVTIDHNIAIGTDVLEKQVAVNLLVKWQ